MNKRIIELSERLMDYWTDNFGQRRTKYYVRIQETCYWSCGRDPEDAIESLIRTHPEQFPLGRAGTEVIYLGKLSR